VIICRLRNALTAWSKRRVFKEYNICSAKQEILSFCGTIRDSIVPTRVCLFSTLGTVGKVSPCSRPHGPRGGRGIAPLFHDLGTRWGWVVNVTSRPPLPPGKTRYPLYRRLGGPQGRSGRVRKISSPTGFNPRTLQPVASRYTD